MNTWCITTQLIKAGGNGTAGTAMAVPVFGGEKWRRLDSNLRVRYRMASSGIAKLRGHTQCVTRICLGPGACSRHEKKKSNYTV